MKRMLLLSAFVIFATQIQAADIWVQMPNPTGAKKPRSIEADKAGNLYTCSSDGGFFMSTDSGKSWNAINGTGLGVNLDKKWHASTLQVDPNTGYLIASQIENSTSFYFRSTDQGAHWTKISGFQGGHPRTSIDGAGFLSNGDILLGVCYGVGPYYSTDHGVSCTLAEGGPGHNGQAEFCFAQNPVTGDCWMGSEVEGNCVFRSTDLGRSWKLLPTAKGLNMDDVLHAAFNKAGDVFFQMIEGVYRSKDTGNTWSKVCDVGTSSKGHGSLRSDPDGSLYAGDGVPWHKGPIMVRSTDGGDTWKPFETGIPNTLRITWLTYNPADGRMYCTVIDYKTDTGGIYRTIDPVTTVPPKAVEARIPSK